LCDFLSYFIFKYFTYDYTKINNSIAIDRNLVHVFIIIYFAETAPHKNSSKTKKHTKLNKPLKSRHMRYIISETALERRNITFSRSNSNRMFVHRDS